MLICLFIKSSHQGRVKEYVEDGKKKREEEWTGNIAAGNKPRREGEGSPGIPRQREKDQTEIDEGCQVRETPAGYNAFLRAEKEDVGPETLIPGILNSKYQ